jgi:hypothetical protein
MPGSLGGGAIIAFAAALWLLVLAPSWVRRRQYLNTERNAVRLQQTLRIMAETSDVPDEVRADLTARSVVEQHRALRVAARSAETHTRSREAAAERSLKRRSTPPPREPAQRAAAVHAETRSRLRRARLLGTAVLVIALGATTYGAWQFVTTHAWMLGAAGIVGVFASLTLLQRVSTAAAAHRVVAAVDHAVSVTEEPQTFIDWQSAGEQRQRPTWTPVPLPKPLYLDRAEAVAADDADHAALLAAASRQSEQALRDAHAAADVPTLEPRQAQDTSPALRDLDAVLRRRRVS